MRFDLAQVVAARDATLVFEGDALLALRGNRDDAVGETLAAALDRGWAWLMEGAEQAQPTFFRAIATASPRLVAVAHRLPDVLQGGHNYRKSLFLQTDACTIEVRPWQPPGQLDLLVGEKHIWSRIYRSLPASIADAYYRRADGMDLTRTEFFCGLYPLGMPGSLTSPACAQDHCGKRRGNKERARGILARLADRAVPDRKDFPKDFRVLLDTRCDEDESETGNLLIYQIHSESRRVFHVPHLDFEKIRLLRDPSKAMDDYCAAVASGGTCDFDFLPYGEACT